MTVRLGLIILGYYPGSSCSWWTKYVNYIALGQYIDRSCRIQVHVLNESRGSTLEVIVSRMKARGSGTRFLLISATVPNVEDVACWIGSRGSSDQPAGVFQVDFLPRTL